MKCYRVIVSLFMTVMVIGTVYDVLYLQWPKSKAQTMAGLLNGEVTEIYHHKITAEEDTPLIGDKTTQEYKPGKYVLFPNNHFVFKRKLLLSEKIKEKAYFCRNIVSSF